MSSVDTGDSEDQLLSRKGIPDQEMVQDRVGSEKEEEWDGDVDKISKEDQLPQSQVRNEMVTPPTVFLEPRFFRFDHQFQLS